MQAEASFSIFQIWKFNPKYPITVQHSGADFPTLSGGTQLKHIYIHIYIHSTTAWLGNLLNQ